MNDVALLTVTPLDYGRSFLIGKGRTNEVRFWIESRTRVIDEKEGISEDFYQTASCKSENTFHDKRSCFNVTTTIILPIFSARYGLIFRRPACLSARYRETRPYAEMFGGYDLHLVEGERIRELPSNASIREETYRFAPLVSQTEIRNEETGLRALIECPVKTMNTRREDDRYQVDTGPLAFPDLWRREARSAGRLPLARLRGLQYPPLRRFRGRSAHPRRSRTPRSTGPPLLEDRQPAVAQPAVRGRVGF